MKTVIDKETAYCYAEIKDGICEYPFSVKKDSPHLAECDFKIEYAKAIKGYFGYCGGAMPKILGADQKNGKFSATIKTDFLEFHLENLEDWISKRQISITEDMKVI